MFVLIHFMELSTLFIISQVVLTFCLMANNSTLVCIWATKLSTFSTKLVSPMKMSHFRWCQISMRLSSGSALYCRLIADLYIYIDGSNSVRLSAGSALYCRLIADLYIYINGSNSVRLSAGSALYILYIIYYISQECGFTGGTRSAPQKVTLFYDYLPRFRNCPILSASFHQEQFDETKLTTGLTVSYKLQYHSWSCFLLSWRASLWVWTPHFNPTSKQKQASLWNEALVLTNLWCSVLNSSW